MKYALKQYPLAFPSGGKEHFTLSVWAELSQSIENSAKHRSDLAIERHDIDPSTTLIDGDKRGDNPTALDLEEADGRVEGATRTGRSGADQCDRGEAGRHARARCAHVGSSVRDVRPPP